MKNKRLISVLLLTILLLGSIPMLIPVTSAVLVHTGTYFTAALGVRNYTVSHTMNFSEIIIYGSYVRFNGTKVMTYGDMGNIPVYIEWDYINESTTGTSPGDLALQFNFTTSEVSVYFEIDNLKPSTTYRVMRNNVNWTYPVASGSGQITFTSLITGTDVDLKIYDYVAPPADTTDPTVTINFAGNRGDKGGPYWLPPGESTALSGVNLNGYYTNSSYQNESWIYINCTLSDNIGVTSAFLHWKNQTSGTWKNTSAFTQHGTYWDINTSTSINTQKGHKYTFDIYAADAAGNTQLIWWNKTRLGGSYTRRYVYLENTPKSIEYKPLYYQDAFDYNVTNFVKSDRLINDQGTDTGSRDTAFLKSTIPTDTVTNIHCGQFMTGWYGNNSCNTPFTLSNIYYHIWWSSIDPTVYNRIGYYDTRSYLLGTTTETYTASNADSVSEIYYNGLTAYDDYYLETNKMTLSTPISYTDNDIYEFNTVFKNGPVGTYTYPSLISNRSFTSFVLFNVPDNATLNASYADTDGDNISDWFELYKSYTNPFLADTDNDSQNDDTEYYGGSDPNNYSSIGPYTAPALPVVTTNDATLVEETTAQLNGLLVDEGGTVSTSSISMYENYTTINWGDSSIKDITKEIWCGQTFTPLVSHYISNVSFYGIRDVGGDSSTLYVAIRAVDGSGKPTGSDLSSGSINSGLISSSYYQWINISVTPFYVVAGTKYAVFVYYPNTISYNSAHMYIVWRVYNGYSRGTGIGTACAGCTWYAYSNIDCYFKEFGYSTTSFPCYVYFQYGYTTSYGNITTSEIKTDYETFIKNISSLTNSRLYHFRAVATNSNGTAYGSDKTFLTKPYEPTGLSIVNTGSNNNQLISWTRGYGCNTTVVRARVDSGYPSNAWSDIDIYNGTGTTKTVNNTFLLPGRLYYYRAWSRASSGGLQQYSDSYASTIGLTKPYAPTKCNTTLIAFNATNRTMRFDWTKGTGANNTRLIYKTTGYPTGPLDGTLVYNGTGTSVIAKVPVGPYYIKAYSFTNYSTYRTFSDNGTTFSNSTTGAFVIYAYDQESLTNLTFTMLMTNPAGTDTYQQLGCTNPHFVNSSLCVHGDNIQILISSPGYGQMTYVLNIYEGIIYTLKAYLPKLVANGTTDCVSTPYIDYFLITNPALDVLMNLTHTVDFIQNVELFNSSTNYWDDVNYTLNANNSVRIANRMIDSNHSMARVTYYYDLCQNITNSYVYYFQVIVDDPQGITIKDAYVEIKRYMSASNLFEVISSMYTDSNGNFNLYMIPGTLYKIIITKDGYQDETVNFIPSTSNFGIITIKMTPGESGGGTTPTYDFLEKVHITGYIDNSTSILYFDYKDDVNQTENIQIRIYDMTNNSVLVYSYNSTGDSIFSFNFSVNNTHDYEVVYRMNHTYFGFKAGSFIIRGYHRTITTMSRFNTLFIINFGFNPFGWSNFITWIIMVACFFSFDRRNTFMIMFLVGFLLLILNYYIGFNTTTSIAAGGVIPVIMIFFGILMLIRDRYRFGVDT